MPLLRPCARSVWLPRWTFLLETRTVSVACVVPSLLLIVLVSAPRISAPRIFCTFSARQFVGRGAARERAKCRSNQSAAQISRESGAPALATSIVFARPVVGCGPAPERAKCRSRCHRFPLNVALPLRHGACFALAKSCREFVCVRKSSNAVLPQHRERSSVRGPWFSPAMSEAGPTARPLPVRWVGARASEWRRPRRSGLRFRRRARCPVRPRTRARR